ncbi:MAG: nucleoside hydrolase-like domain-containing protein [Pseudomonadota bacterium]
MKAKYIFLASIALALALASGTDCLAAQPGKPRVVITADPELDDFNSLVRYLLFSSDYATEGLIYASSQFHWKGDGKGTKRFVPGREYSRFGLQLCPCNSWRWTPDERFIDDAVEAYAWAYDSAWRTASAERRPTRR